jgi:hypothetical protein
MKGAHPGSACALRIALVASLLASAHAQPQLSPAQAPRAAGTQAKAEVGLALAQLLELPAGSERPWIGALEAESARSSIVCALADGRVRVLRHAGEALPFAPQPVGDLQLAEPARCVLAIGELDGAPGFELLALGPAGAQLHARTPEGAFAAQASALAPRARFELRTRAPRFAPLLADLDGDAAVELLVPGLERCEIWKRPAARGQNSAASQASTASAWSRAARVPLPARHVSVAHYERLGESLEERIALLAPRTSDVNGDGRADLVLEDEDEIRWLVQRADGQWPEEADARLELGLFVDTTPPAQVEPGRTLVAFQRAQLARRELDGDGRVDSVIAHGRKVWVFRGEAGGPQFARPSQVLKAAEDITAHALVDVDRDGRADLLLVKLQVPSVAGFLLGMLGAIELRIDCNAYRNEGEGKFATLAQWRRSLRLELPPLSEMLRRPERILARFEELALRIEQKTEADFDGDGALDLALYDASARELRVWLGRGSGSWRPLDPDEILRDALFEQDERWDLESLLAFLGALRSARSQSLTQGRAPDALLRVDPPAPAANVDAEGAPVPPRLGSADAQGDGRAELLLEWPAAVDGLRRIGVYEWRGALATQPR